MSKRRRESRRSTKQNAWDEEFLCTNPESRLVGLDLVELFSNPRAWTCLDEDEKRQILELLPENTHPEAENHAGEPDYIIPPLPAEFLRYSMNWRDALRHFQLDLQSGKYDPEWQRQAAHASEERTRGMFDAWKEEKFEQFWGQKQKLHWSRIAGESSKIKLQTLILENVIRPRDVWKFSRVYKKGGILVEKECKIAAIKGETLSVLIPPGQRVTSCSGGHVCLDSTAATGMHASPASSARRVDAPSSFGAETTENTIASDHIGGDRSSLEAQNNSNIDVIQSTTSIDAGVASSSSPPMQLSRMSVSASCPITENETRTGKQPSSSSSSSNTAHRALDLANADQPCSTSKEVMRTTPHDGEPRTEAVDMKASPSDQALTGHTQPDSGHTSSPLLETDKYPRPSNSQFSRQDATGTEEDHVCPRNQQEDQDTGDREDILYENVKSPQQLCNKIFEIDGRVSNPPNGNAWKEIRCLRDNQDMGCLWEIRHAWFMRQS